MEMQHKNLTVERWNQLSFFEKMGNIGSEVGRAISWKNKNNAEYSRLAFERALELLDLTVKNENDGSRLKELLRLREALADYFAFENMYGSTDSQWQRYFHAFNYAARINR